MTNAAEFCKQLVLQSYSAIFQLLYQSVHHSFIKHRRRIPSGFFASHAHGTEIHVVNGPRCAADHVLALSAAATASFTWRVIAFGRWTSHPHTDTLVFAIFPLKIENSFPHPINPPRRIIVSSLWTSSGCSALLWCLWKCAQVHRIIWMFSGKPSGGVRLRSIPVLFCACGVRDVFLVLKP